MTRRTLSSSAALTVTLALLVAACSSSGATTAPTTAPTSAASEAVASQAAPSTAASEAASEAPAGSQGGLESFAIPSFVLPSDDKGLEALLPAKLCGKTATKLSMSGDRFAAVSDQTFIDTLSKLGKTAKDVSFAVAVGAPNSGCDETAVIFRVAGADPGRLKDFFIAAAKQQDKTTYTTGSVGGKDVYIGTRPDSTNKTYAWFNGDALLFVEAADDATAAPLVQGMP